MESAASGELGWVARTREHGDRLAVVAADGSLTYRELLAASARVAAGLLAGRGDLEEGRVAFLVPPGCAHVAIEWGIWRAGGVAVPLAVSHPPAELGYVLADAEVEAAVAHPDFAGALAPLCRERGLALCGSEELLAAAAPAAAALPAVAPGRRAMILYTSGTTSRPKGAVWSHAGLAAQVSTLIAAWGWVPEDRILHVLPLHHVHGIVNALTSALAAGAACEFLDRFDAAAVWEAFASGRITLFMAVPTVYHRLIAAWDEAPRRRREEWSRGARGLRLMVSGSAALPVPTLERWREITGHTLLERYGMTEIGMALSNPLAGRRVPGAVGAPLPGVEVRLVGEGGRPPAPGEPGEIEVRGPGLFREYWRRPEATASAFRDGWFRTGDVAVVEGGVYRILGRQSVDIIKSGGYKLSALEIEEVLLRHPGIAECAVVGVADPEWGERVAAAVVPAAGAAPSLEALRDWARPRLAPYKLPTRLLVLDRLPRNALGKVVKPELAARFGAGE